MNMRKVPTEIIGDAHAYTRSDVPWAIPSESPRRTRLIEFISGGGMRTFGRTVRQEEIRQRQRRFLVVSAALATVWLLLLVF